MHTRMAIIGGGPAGHTAAIYAARAELEPIMFEGWMAGGIAPGGQLTTTTYVENFPGFVEPIMGIDLTDKFRLQSVRYGTRIFTETVTTIDLQSHMHRVSIPGLYGAPGHASVSLRSAEDEPPPGSGDSHSALAHNVRPFTLHTPERVVTADAVIIATGASAKRLRFPGSGDEAEGGYWNRGISACAICDGASPLIRNKPVAVVGGGDSAMEEAMFLTRYASKVYIIHRFNYLEASKSMARRALANPKIEILWNSEVKEAHGNDQECLGSITVARSLGPAVGVSGPGNLVQAPSAAAAPTKLERVEVNGLFFAIGHKPATEFLQGQLELDEYGYIITMPGSTATSVPGVFAAGDVMDRKFRQAITAAGSGCMAALEAERYLQALDSGASAPLAAAASVPQQYTSAAPASQTPSAAFDFSSASQLQPAETQGVSGGA
ncbi:hypothetical protein HYH03_017870 [Edaphochlamys debaryana]|uniref:FAD/NAD(P)-binding domain-containing protein n=1 Tax=Edaphochlamys debaryana TaxID=47281 RepID=A0A835XEX3_9CHLO|nr:hypothetical protein HYH03_017870 [Edaphochlamys debaryana]|eukprot:KAG2483272.1 hypothetical protein HYH03_017870 [Edaphochlamys debaryana]